MSLRARPTPPDQTTDNATIFVSSDADQPKIPKASQSSLSPTLVQRVLTSTGNLANLLPTGTLLAFQLLTPIVTNNGVCDAATRPITLVLLFVLAGSCFLASFTDSFTSGGQVYYGFVTNKGMWLFDYQAAAMSPSGLPDLRKYKLNFIDGVHAVLSVLVFIAVALKDKNVLSCLYPLPAHETQEVLQIVPITIGLICSLLFMVFPTRRHGIGYPVSTVQNNSIKQ